MTEVEQIYTHHPYKRYASEGLGAAGLATGIVGTVLGAANSGLLGGALNGWGNRGMGYGGPGMGYGVCDSAMPVTRYEADLQAKIADKDSRIGLLEADKYTDQKIADVYERIDRRFNSIEDRLCHQAVINAQLTSNLGCMQNTINTLAGMTKTVIPIDNVCPQPMTRFNTWVAPTATADAADTVVTG